MVKVEAYPHNIFDEICKKNNWNDDNVGTLNDKAFISIIGTKDVQEQYLREYHEHWFKENHPNVLNLEFDDVKHDIEFDDYKAYVITNEQAKQIVEFIENNLGKQFFIHCLAGISRSGAVRDFIYRNYDYYKDSEGGEHIRPNVEVLRKLNRVLWNRNFN